MSANIERRIAKALANNAIASADLTALIRETELAIAAADTSAEEERTKALDPVLSPDPKAARAAMEHAAFTRDRLRTVLPRLREHYSRREAQEEREQWRAKAAAMAAERDALATEFAEVYPRAVAELVDLMKRTDALEKQIKRLNNAAPSGEGHLLSVELTARGLPQPNVWVCDTIRLPHFRPQDREPAIAWPPPQSPFIGGISFEDAMRLSEAAARVPSPCIGDARNNTYPNR
jgi:hypothetical protein